MTYLINFMIICFALYGVFAAWCGAKIMTKTGESERFWFYVLFITNFWGFLFLLIRPSFRKGLPLKETVNLTLLAIGYWALFFPTLLVMGAFR
jgi:hypothetical protein